MVLLIISLAISLLFVGIGFLITEKSAPSMLSGYRSLSNEEKKAFKLVEYVNFFRQFHFFLGGSMLFLSLVLYFLGFKDAVGMLLGFYPLLAYIYFMLRTRSLIGSKQQKSYIISFWILVVSTIGVGILMFYGYSPSQLEIQHNQIEISGMYGDEIPFEQIKTVELVSELPEIRMKTNGFATESMKKGYFKTKQGETVKLLIEGKNKTFILITLKNGKKIYYSDYQQNISEIYQAILSVLPSQP